MIVWRESVKKYKIDRPAILLKFATVAFDIELANAKNQNLAILLDFGLIVLIHLNQGAFS